MWTYQAYVALQIATERAREANEYRLAAAYRAGRRDDFRSLRRSIAGALASISSAAAAAARRLDQRVAADLAERLGPDQLAARH
jgi:hypothetical protein